MPRYRDPQTNQLLPEGVRPMVSDRTGRVTYRARFTTGSGARRRFHARTFTDARDAEAWLLSQRLDVARGRHRDTADMTVAEYYERWIARMARSWSGSRVKTVRMVWRRYAADALGGMRLQRVGRAECQFLVDAMARQGLKAATVRLYMVGIVSMLDDAVKDDLIPANPAAALTYPRDDRAVRDVWSPLQLRAFLTRTRDDELGSLWAFLIATGCRIGEALALRWSDIDLDAGTVWIHRTLARDAAGRYVGREGTKTSRTGRTVPLDTWVVAVLGRRDRTHALVWHQAGEPWSPSTVRDRWARAVKAAGLPPITLHDVRHSVASAMVAAGVHERIVQEVLGHASITTTMNTYSHVGVDTQRQGTQAVTRLLGLDVVDDNMGGREAES